MSPYEQQELDDERGAELGDPRRCPRHPEEQTSSRDGMFDAPCGRCEWEMESYGERADYEAECHVSRLLSDVSADPFFSALFEDLARTREALALKRMNERVTAEALRCPF